MTRTTARVGTNNRSQIVTIPLAFRFPEDYQNSLYPQNWRRSGAVTTARQLGRFLGLGPQVSEDFMATLEDQAVQERESL